MSASAPDTTAPPNAARLQDAASELAVTAAGADALAQVLLLASVVPRRADLLDVEPNDVDELVAAAEDLRSALDTFACRASPELADGLRARIDWAEGRARHDRSEAMRAAEGDRSTS